MNRGPNSGGPSSTPASSWRPRSTASTGGRPRTSRSSKASTRLAAAAGGRHRGHQPAVPAGHALGHVREERLPRVVPRPDGVGPHVPGEREGPRRAAVRRTEAHEDRGPLLEATDIVLCPAACHPLYPTQSGILPEGGRTFEIVGYCFRHEPSTDPFRMQSFRQHEYVYLGTPDGARAHRDRLDRAGGWTCSPASGWRSSRWWPTTRSSAGPAGCWRPTSGPNELKFEIVTPAFADRRPTAISSSNCHLDHFSASVRHHHGRRRAGPHGVLRLRGRPDHPRPARPARNRPGRWPAGVRSVLWP